MGKLLLKKKLGLFFLLFLLLYCTSATPYSKIEKERVKIDHIDKKVVDLLSKRMKIAMQIGAIKKENQIEVTQPSRWQAVKDAVRKRAVEKEVDPDMIVKMYEVFYNESVKQQQDLQKSK